jgi:hypothetical protein
VPLTQEEMADLAMELPFPWETQREHWKTSDGTEWVKYTPFPVEWPSSQFWVPKGVKLGTGCQRAAFIRDWGYMKDYLFFVTDGSQDPVTHINDRYRAEGLHGSLMKKIKTRKRRKKANGK